MAASPCGWLLAATAATEARGERKELGWKPKHVNAVLSTIPSDVDEVLKRMAEEKEKGGK